MRGRMWKHEMCPKHGHDGQRERLGLVRFILAVVFNIIISLSYRNNAIEGEAQAAEKL